uniref:Esterase n=1 Tax=Oryza punctata TaxID=4537 RepID=A0A0E0M7A6_ORYPU
MAPFSPRLLAAAAAAALIGVLATASSAVARGETAAYTRVFSFGDSLTDTGNALHLPSTGGGGPASRPPYGETFFRRPTGRASDGRLAVDFVVEALRLRHPAPYLAGGETAAEFRHGVNFAVGGSTSLPPEFYEGRGLKPFVPVSLANQTVWFDKVLQILGSSDHGRRKIMASSLFIVGEIGVNDYLVSLIGNLTVGEVKTSVVPHIVAAIRSAVNEVIAAGATTVVVPGMIPLGCEPQLLALYQGGGGDAGDYDAKSGCMTRLNGLAEHHNRELNRAIAELRGAHPGASVAYADLYRAVTDIVVSPGRYGFRDRPLAACCGGGAGAYNFNMTAFCGASGSTACADPSAYVSWDGVHFTEAANRHIACAVLKGRPYDDGGAPPAAATPTTWPTAAEAGRSRIGCS